LARRCEHCDEGGSGRAGRIGVDLISRELTKLLDTNPTRARPDEVLRLVAESGRTPEELKAPAVDTSYRS